jgi:putative transposase
VPKLAPLVDNAEAAVLASTAFPKEHRAKIQGANRLERLNKEVKRRTDVVGVFPSEAAIIHLVGAILTMRRTLTRNIAPIRLPGTRSTTVP